MRENGNFSRKLFSRFAHTYPLYVLHTARGRALFLSKNKIPIADLLVTRHSARNLSPHTRPHVGAAAIWKVFLCAARMYHDLWTGLCSDFNNLAPLCPFPLKNSLGCFSFSALLSAAGATEKCCRCIA